MNVAERNRADVEVSVISFAGQIKKDAPLIAGFLCVEILRVSGRLSVRWLIHHFVSVIMEMMMVVMMMSCSCCFAPFQVASV